MKPLFLIRLVLDFVAAGLLLAALAYNLMGNLLHEIVGTAMFALLIGHNLFNRRWYGTVLKGRPEPRTLITKGINLSLFVSMLTLLITSVIISQAVFSFLPLSSTVSARQIHTMVGYLAMLIVAVHLGLHWTMIMGVVRRLLKVTEDSRARTVMLRIFATGIASFGIQSLIAVNVSSKLLMQFSMEFWDFQSATVAFFLHHVAIIGLGAAIGHYASQSLRLKRSDPNAGDGSPELPENGLAVPRRSASAATRLKADCQHPTPLWSFSSHRGPRWVKRHVSTPPRPFRADYRASESRRSLSCRRPRLCATSRTLNPPYHLAEAVVANVVVIMERFRG